MVRRRCGGGGGDGDVTARVLGVWGRGVDARDGGEAGVAGRGGAGGADRPRRCRRALLDGPGGEESREGDDVGRARPAGDVSRGRVWCLVCIVSRGRKGPGRVRRLSPPRARGARGGP